MAFKRRFRKRRRPRRKMRISKFRPSTRSFGTVVGGFPDRMTVRLKYVQSLRLDTAFGGAPVSQVYRGNGIFDPDLTGVGHQPMNRDIWADIYEHYYVTSSAITVKAVSALTGSSAAPCHLTVVPTRTTASAGIMTTAQERPRAKNILIGFQGRARTIKHRVSTAAMLPFRNSSLLSQQNLLPADAWYWHIVTEGMTAGDESKVDIITTIIYTVKFFERQVQSQS